MKSSTSHVGAMPTVQMGKARPRDQRQKRDDPCRLLVTADEVHWQEPRVPIEEGARSTVRQQGPAVSCCCLSKVAKYKESAPHFYPCPTLLDVAA